MFEKVNFQTKIIFQRYKMSNKLNKFGNFIFVNIKIAELLTFFKMIKFNSLKSQRINNFENFKIL